MPWKPVSLVGAMTAAPPARIPLTCGAVMIPARHWCLPLWSTAASMLYLSNVVLKLNSKQGNIVPLLVHISGYRAQTGFVTLFDEGRWIAQGDRSSRSCGDPAAEPWMIFSKSL